MEAIGALPFELSFKPRLLPPPADIAARADDDDVERHDVSHPKAMDELDLTSGTIVTRNDDKRIATGRGAISVVPTTKQDKASGR